MSLLERFRNTTERLTRTRRAYHAVFRTPEGELVLRDLLRHCGVLVTSQVAGDPHMTAFNEGKRSIALHLMHVMRWTEAEVNELALARTAEQLDAQQEE